MKKMLMASLFALVIAAPLMAAPGDKCCGKPRPKVNRAADKCGCNANKPKGRRGNKGPRRAKSTTESQSKRGSGSCNSCSSCCNNKPCCR